MGGGVGGFFPTATTTTFVDESRVPGFSFYYTKCSQWEASLQGLCYVCIYIEV